MASPNSQSQSQPINLSTLPIPQLTSIKNQLTQELQHLTNSFAQLRAAQAKFRDCIKSIREGIEKEERKPNENTAAQQQQQQQKILVPLTPSLYVPGTLVSTETVLVDIGTGFYVEKPTNPIPAVPQKKKKNINISPLNRGTADTARSAQILHRESRGAGQEPEGSGDHCAGEAREPGRRGGWYVFFPPSPLPPPSQE
ncbi:MAG: hypothetical protein L6R40_007023 [Gallowayella cf. fulva]|nr:MAG: hypothetical protein L6R40_007023 [Xanthomendoza cf. fulva]